MSLWTIIDDSLGTLHTLFQIMFKLFIIVSIMVLLQEGAGKDFDLTSRLILIVGSLIWCYPDFKKVIIEIISIGKPTGEEK